MQILLDEEKDESEVSSVSEEALNITDTCKMVLV